MKKLILTMAISLSMVSLALGQSKTKKDTTKFAPLKNPNFEYFVKLKVEDTDNLLKIINSYKNMIPWDYTLKTDKQKVDIQMAVNLLQAQLMNTLKVDSLKK